MLGLGVVCAVGVLVAYLATTPAGTLLMAALVGAFVLTWKGGQLQVILWGGALAFASGGIGAVKIAYAALLGALNWAPRATGHVWATPNQDWASRARLSNGNATDRETDREHAEVQASTARANKSAGLIWAVIAGGIIVGGTNGSLPENMGRDAATYAILAFCLPLSFRSVSSVSARTALVTLVLFGTFTSVAFAVNVLEARGVGLLGATRFAGGSMIVIVAASAVILAGVAYGNFRWWLSLFPMMWLATVLVSGTRTGLVLFVVPLAVFAVSSTSRGVRSQQPRRAQRPRLFGSLLFSAAAVLGLVLLVGDRLVPIDFIAERLDVTRGFFDGGVSSDASGRARLEDNSRAITLFQDSPILGHGFGQILGDGVDVNTGFYLDTPVLLLAKFGILGTIVIVVALSMWVRALFRRVSGVDNRAGRAAVLAAATGMVALVPFGAVTEDKGLGIAMVVLTTGVLVALAGKQSDAKQSSERLEDA